MTRRLAAAASRPTTPELEVAPVRGNSTDGVSVERLRAGTEPTLFVVPGLEGDPNELTGLVAALTGPQAVYALSPNLLDDHHQPITTIEQMATLMVAAIRGLAPDGPYRLAGYSFGGLIALEIAQQLRAAGAQVGSLFLIDVVPDERYWPRAIWVQALARRTGRQLAQIAKMPPAQAGAELRRRSARLAQRVARRSTQDATAPAPAAPDATELSTRAHAAIGQYAPQVYNGHVTLIASSVDRHFGCDTTDLWLDLAPNLHIQRVVGDHLTVMQDRQSAAAVAAVIDHELAIAGPAWPGVVPRPGFERPMLLTTMRWFSAGRLAHAMSEAGFVVSACHPKDHALEVVDSLTSDSRLRKLTPLRSVTKAIRRADPDIILCDDERALALLRRLHARSVDTAPDIAALIAHSLGTVQQWPTMTSRAGLADEARRLDVLAPDTTVVADLDSLRTWVADRPLPIVLKTDGSWGGRGVAIVRDADRLAHAWRTLSNPPGPARGLKRAVVDLEPGSLLAWLRRRHPVVNAQAFVGGREAIVTAACVNGTVQALVCLEVAQVSEARGPAAAVRIITHDGMTDAARRLVRSLGLTGFCGFDFIIDSDDRAHLLEINPRVTPTCHLLVEGDYQRSRVLALFPPDAGHDAGRDASTGRGDTLDIPVRAPALIEHGRKWTERRGRRVSVAVRRIQHSIDPANG